MPCTEPSQIYPQHHTWFPECCLLGVIPALCSVVPNKQKGCFLAGGPSCCSSSSDFPTTDCRGNRKKAGIEARTQGFQTVLSQGLVLHLCQAPRLLVVSEQQRPTEQQQRHWGVGVGCLLLHSEAVGPGEGTPFPAHPSSTGKWEETFQY